MGAPNYADFPDLENRAFGWYSNDSSAIIGVDSSGGYSTLPACDSDCFAMKNSFCCLRTPTLYSWATWISTALLAIGLSACTSSESIRSPESGVDTPNEDGLNRFVGLSATEMERRYERAAGYLSWNVRQNIYYAPVRPVWLEDGSFWYRIRTSEGTFFRYYDSETGQTTPAFDHRLLAEAIAGRRGRSVREGDLPFGHFRYLDGRSKIRFALSGEIWTCNLENYVCEDPAPRRETPESSVVAPDRQQAAFLRDQNLWIWTYSDDTERPVTSKGEPGYGYATDSQGWTRSDRPVLAWSPDSRRIATYRLNEKEVARMSLIRTRMGRPELETWPYALPGDSIRPKLERVVIDLERDSLIALDLEPGEMRTSNCCGLLRDGRWADVEWSPDGSTLAFLETSRDYRTVTLYLADPETGSVREVMSETAEPFFESGFLARELPNWRVLHESDELLWFSPRDNWGHLYLYDLQDGTLKNRITKGEWNVLQVLHVDLKDRTVLFTAVGKEKGVDPYFASLYRASLDGGDIRRLTPQDEHHQVHPSPDGRFAVVNRSRPDQLPVAEFYDLANGDIVELEQAELDEDLSGRFPFPSPFTVKARDGKTDLYGLLYKPSDFDPAKTYPVINVIYPGPQTGSVGTRSFSTYRRGQAYALAELGFIVVQLDGLGTPLRSRDFHTWWVGNLSDNGLQDQVAAMNQLASRYSWFDIERVGITGHSGGGYATVAAMLRYPEFFSVGVAGAGNMDNRGYTDYWGEKYQGPVHGQEGEADAYRNQAIYRLADRLEGKLLITYGTMDSNVHPNMTLQLVDRLIRHNQSFDLMVFPNRDHGYVNEPYNLKLTWDYFVRHLLESDPPEQFPPVTR